MRRIRNSVKAIIISCVAVVCVLAIVLGCVFGLKKGKPDPNNQAYAFTEAQKKLAEEINSNVDSGKTTYEVIDDVPFKCDISSIQLFGENYYTYTDENDDTYLTLYRKKVDGSYEYKELIDLFPFENVSEVFTSANSTGYAMMAITSTEEIMTYKVFYIGDFDNPIQILEITQPDGHKFNSEYSFFNDYYFGYCDYYDFVSSYREDSFNLYVYPLKTTPFTDEEISSANYTITDVSLQYTNICYEDSYIAVMTEYGLNVLSYKDGDINKKSIAYDNPYGKVINLTELNNNKILVEVGERLSSSSTEKDYVFDNGTRYKYSYDVITLDGNNVGKTSVSLNGYAKIGAFIGEYMDLNESYVLYRQEVDEDHNLIEDYNCAYYDKDDKLILEFNTKTYQEYILYAGDKTFLTNDRIIAGRNSTKMENVYEFVEDIVEGKYELYTTSFSSKIFPVRINGGQYGLMDIDGNIVLDPEEFSFRPYLITDNYAIGYHDEEKEVEDDIVIETTYYKYDFTSKQLTELNLDNNSNYIMLLEKGFDGYFEKDANEDSYTLKSGAGTDIVSGKITNISPYSVFGGAILQLDDKYVYIKSDNYFKFKTNDAQEEDETFVDDYGSNVESYGMIESYYTDELGTTTNHYFDTEVYTESKKKKYHIMYFAPSTQGQYYTKSCLYYKWCRTYHAEISTKGHLAQIGYDIDEYSNYKDAASDRYDEENLIFMYYNKNNNDQIYFDAGHSNNHDGHIFVRVKIDADDDDRLKFIHIEDDEYEYAKYKIHLDYNNGTYIPNPYTFYNWSYRGYARSSTDFNNNTKITSVAIPENLGHTFIGYYTEKENTDGIQVIKADGTFVDNNPYFVCTYKFTDHPWYAHWEVNKYSVTIDPNGGLYGGKSGTTTITDIEYGKTFTVNAPTYAGFTFSGWDISNMSTDCSKTPSALGVKNATATSTATTYGSLRSTSGTVTFKAKWTANEFHVQFNLFTANKNYKGLMVGGINGYTETELRQDINSGIDYILSGERKTCDQYFTTQKSVLTFSVDNGNSSLQALFKTIARNQDAIIQSAMYRDSQNNYSKISITNSTYQIVGWLYTTYSNTSKYYEIYEDNNIHLGDIIDLSQTHSSSDTNNPNYIRLYALYAPRSYYVDLEWGNFGGSTKVEASSDLNNGFYEDANLRLQYGVQSNGNFKVNNTSGISNKNRSLASAIDIGNNNTATFIFKTMQPSYIVDSIQIRDFPYRTGNKAYAKTTVYINIIWNSNNITFELQWGTGSSLSNLVSQLENGTTYYYVNSNAINDKLNGIAISAARDNDNQTFNVTLTIKNVGYASDDDFTKTPTDLSVSSSGKVGFVVAPYVTSYFSYGDSVSAENEGLQEFKPGEIFEYANQFGYTEYYAVPVSVQSNSRGVWLGGTYYSLNNLNVGFYQLGSNGSLTSKANAKDLSNDDIIYYDGSSFVYHKINDKVNFGNTQIIAISPEQDIFYTSNNSTHFKAGRYYELVNYLSGINIKGTSYVLERPTRTINGYTYDEVEFSARGVNKIEIGNNTTISYFGNTYIKTCCYNLTGSGFNYKIYMAYRETDNQVMYFLFSESSLPCADNGVRTGDIILQFDEFNLTTTINQNINSPDDKYATNSYGLDISYTNADVSGTTTVSPTSATSTISNILPREARIFAFRPQNGYLINTIQVTVGNELLYKFTLDPSSIGGVFNNNTFSLYSTTLSGSVSSTNVLIRYINEANSNLTAFRPRTSESYFNGTFWGMYFSNIYPNPTSSNTPSSSSLWGTVDFNNSGFESFYLLVSGIYDDVEINVTTISYFEFDFIDPNNHLGLEKALSGDYSDVRLSILRKGTGNNSFSDVLISSLFDNQNIFLKKMTSGDLIIYRLIFFGVANLYGGGFAFFASDMDYSNYFNNLIFYGSSQALDKDSVFSNPNALSISHNIVYKTQFTDLIYLETGNDLPTFFSAYRMLPLYAYKNVDSQYVSNYKFQAIFTVNKNNTYITTNSYLSNENLTPSGNVNSNDIPGIVNGTISLTTASNKIRTEDYGKVVRKTQNQSFYYQLDDPTSKVNSWFNDTVLTNISYSYNADISNNSSQRAEAQEFSTNWQNVYDSHVLNNVSGYQIELIYYAIPGYYLQYIDIYTLKTGWFYIQNTGGNFGQATLRKSVPGSNTPENCNLTYKVEYKVENDGNGYYHIYLYDQGDSTLNKLNSVGILADSLIVNFYSKANNIRVQYNANIDSSTISTSSTFNHPTQEVDTAVYDSLYTLKYDYTMTGYTFIGWGSESYDGTPRFTPSTTNSNISTPNAWNSASSWQLITEYFAVDNRSNLVSFATTPADNRFDSFDFYVAGGYLVSDTGYQNAGIGQMQNYNFWSAYASLFLKDLCAISNSSKMKVRDSEYTYQTITLYGIWKPNTYNVVLNLNDHGNNNGSTSSQFAREAVTYVFDPTDYSGIVNPGDLRYNATSSSNNTQSVFVTFDTNDWYVIERTISSIDYSFDDFNTGSIARKQSLKDYVIDRYGYTWLGWFSAKISNYRETENGDRTNIGNNVMPIWYTNQYSSVSQVAFPKLDASTYNKLKNSGAEGSSTLTDNFTDYFHLNNDKSVYNNRYISKFIYKNELGTFNNGADTLNRNTYIYFYIYGASGENKGDYLNGYAKNYDNYFTYYDTAIDYMSYKGSEEAQLTWFANTDSIKYNSSVTVYEKINNYRSITLFAYWQTNLYTVLVDYRDKSSPINSKTGIGSTSVVLNSNRTFAPVYFDDDLASRLNTFIPVRLGYDFIGWSFDPKINRGTSGLQDYEFVKATTYGLNVDNTNFLFIKNTTRDLLLSSDIERLGDQDNNTHAVYLFAGWTAQEFSINASLNISAEELENLYREDSEFTLALYENAFTNYTGLKQSFAMTVNSNKLEFVDIIANITFTITFDTNINTAVFKLNNVSYHLNDLFATSAGYYLISWLYDPNDESKYFVSNSLNSTFDESGMLSNKLNASSGLNEGESNVIDQIFDEEFYNKLYYSFYERKNAATPNKLQDRDFAPEMVLKTSSNVNYFDTFESSTNKSTNFGYIQENGRDFYLAVENVNGKYYMYYYKVDGTKQYVTPYLIWPGGSGGTYEIANTGSGSNLTFDGVNFYYNGYVVYFENDSSNNAYYTIGNYGYNSSDIANSNLKRINILITTRNDIDDETVEQDGKQRLTYFPVKTRQITMYASWAIKNDLSISITNGNNGDVHLEGTPQSNPGLSGFFDIWTTNKEATTTDEIDQGDYEDGLELSSLYFYENANYVIYPFYNGRYLSEMELTFYSYEDIGNAPTGYTTSYQKVKYVIILKFSFDSTRRTLSLQADRTRLERNGAVVNGIDFTLNSDGILKITGTNKLTNLDLDGFSDEFLSILGYNIKLPETYKRNSSYNERQDLNAIQIAMGNIKTSIQIVCNFSIQTFIAEFYNVFDETGNNMQALGGAENQYLVNGIATFDDLLGSIDSARYASGISTLGVNLGAGDVMNLSTTSFIPTVSIDCYASSGQYNVPYGTFMYGNEQSRSPNVDLELGQEKYGGYNFIFEEFYNYGITSERMSYEQCQSSPLLGSPSIYVQSMQKATTLYTFRSWYEITQTADNIIFDEYTSSDEETFINRNIFLFGYYYANNKPTNIQFYTWSDEGVYTEYSNNVDVYTLQSTTTNSAYMKSETTKIIPNESTNLKVNNDTEKKAIILFSRSYGIDAVGFSTDHYSSNYIKNYASNKQFVNDILIRNYWYYRYQNYYLYFEQSGNRKYIRYDTDSAKFYYLEDENNNSSSKHYIELYTSDLKDNTFVVYADLNPQSSGVKINNDNELNKYINQANSPLTRMLVDNTDYTYNFTGSEMYAYYKDNAGKERYYKIKKTEDYLNDSSLSSAEQETISQLLPQENNNTKPSAKFYVKLNNNLYFLIATNGNSGSTITEAFNFYKFSSGAFIDALELKANGVTVTTIDNYFFVLNDSYYQVKYPVTEDENGGYINPYDGVNTCDVDIVVNGVPNVRRFYFDYQNKEFYQNYNETTKTYSQRVTSDQYPGYKKYTPVNDNYSVEIGFNESSTLWEYRSVKIKSLPDPTIGLWYGYGEQSKQYYGYIGYINVLESDIEYLVDLTLDTVDASGNKTDPNKLEHKDRIYDTLVKYIDRTFAGTGVDLNGLYAQAMAYANSYKNNKGYLANLITVSPTGFVYAEGSTSVVEAVDVLLTCNLTLTVNGVEQAYSPTVKYRFNLITTDTSISENIYAIPIYCRNAIEFSADSAMVSGSNQVSVDTSKMTIQVFENIGNVFTHMYTKENGDYLRFAVLNESQYYQMKSNPDYPSELTNILNSNPDIKPVKEEEFEGGIIIPIPETITGQYYIVAYYNKSGQDYPFRISDNIICASVNDGEITLRFV